MVLRKLGQRMRATVEEEVLPLIGLRSVAYCDSCNRLRTLTMNLLVWMVGLRGLKAEMLMALISTATSTRFLPSKLLFPVALAVTHLTLVLT
jgi:hypothetical protein